METHFFNWDANTICEIFTALVKTLEFLRFFPNFSLRNKISENRDKITHNIMKMSKYLVVITAIIAYLMCINMLFCTSWMEYRMCQEQNPTKCMCHQNPFYVLQNVFKFSIFFYPVRLQKSRPRFHVKICKKSIFRFGNQQETLKSEKYKKIGSKV